MRLLATLSAGLVVAATATIGTAPAEAQHYRGWHGGYNHGGSYGYRGNHGYRGGNYGYRGGGYRYRGYNRPYYRGYNRGYRGGYGRPYYGGYRGYRGYDGYRGYNGWRGSRVVCNRFWYHGRLVRNCRRIGW